MKKYILGLITITMVVSLYGCSTIKGVGDDISTLGGWLIRGSEHVEESVKNNPPGSGMDK